MDFIQAVFDLPVAKCPEFNVYEMDEINENKFLVVTRFNDKPVGVYIYRPNIRITDLWTINEEI